jgi:phosphohistidine phosphatase SixA
LLRERSTTGRPRRGAVVSGSESVYDDDMPRPAASLARCAVLLSRAAVLLVALAAPAAVAHKAIFVVRHAEKASSTDPDTPLAAQGQDRALKLASMLRNAGVTHVFVSDKKRTQQTAQELVEQRGLPAPVVLPAADTAKLVAQLKAVPKDAVVLVVGHSDTIPGILKGLGVEPAVVIQPDQYGRIFLVTNDLRLVELAY